MTIYMKCTTDKYELPLAVEDSPTKLARTLGLKPHSVATLCSKQICGYHRIQVDEEEEMTMTNNEIVRNYLESKNKRQQIEILADLNATDKDTIKGILKAAGIDMRSANTRLVKIEAADPVPGEIGYVPIKSVEKHEPKGIVSREEAEKNFSESRIRDIIYAMHRYYECEHDIPEEWKAELKERL